MFFDEKNLPGIIKNIEIVNEPGAEAVPNEKAPRPCYSGEKRLISLLPYTYMLSCIERVLALCPAENKSFSPVRALIIIDAVYSWSMRVREPFYISKLTDAMWRPEHLRFMHNINRELDVREKLGIEGAMPYFYLPVSPDDARGKSFEDIICLPHYKYTYQVRQAPEENSMDDIDMMSFTVRTLSALMLIYDKIPALEKYLSKDNVQCRKNLSDYYSGSFSWINKDAFGMTTGRNREFRRGSVPNDIAFLFPLNVFEYIYTWMSVIPEQILVPHKELWEKRLLGIKCDNLSGEIYRESVKNLTGLDKSRFAWQRSLALDCLKPGAIISDLGKYLGRDMDIKFSRPCLHPVNKVRSLSEIADDMKEMYNELY